MLSDILSVLPQTKVFCEPFGGSGVVLLNKPPSKIEVFNDKSDLIVNFFKVLRENPEELIYKLSLTPYSRTEFLSAVNTVQSEPDPIEKARKFFIIVQSSVNHITNINSSHWSTPYVSEKIQNLRDRVNRFCTHVDLLINVAQRLRTVCIENKDAIDIIKQYDSKWTTFYCDPPYPHECRNDTKLYGCEMSTDQHVTLANTLRQCKGYVLLSTYENNLYNELYKDWTKITKQVKISSACKNRQATEVLFANYIPTTLNKSLTIERLCANDRQIPQQETLFDVYENDTTIEN